MGKNEFLWSKKLFFLVNCSKFFMIQGVPPPDFFGCFRWQFAICFILSMARRYQTFPFDFCYFHLYLTSKWTYVSCRNFKITMRSNQRAIGSGIKKCRKLKIQAIVKYYRETIPLIRLVIENCLKQKILWVLIFNYWLTDVKCIS